MLDAVQVQDCKNKQIEQSRAFARHYYMLFTDSTKLPRIVTNDILWNINQMILSRNYKDHCEYTQ